MSLYESGITLSEEDLAFRDEWRAWLDANLPRGTGREATHFWETEAEREEFLRGWRRKLHEGGWTQITWPKEHGGRDAGVLQQLIFREELIARRLPDRLIRATVGGTDPANLVAAVLMTWGSDAQREYF